MIFPHLKPTNQSVGARKYAIITRKIYLRHSGSDVLNSGNAVQDCPDCCPKENGVTP